MLAIFISISLTGKHLFKKEPPMNSITSIRLSSCLYLLIMLIMVVTTANLALADYDVTISSAASINGGWSGESPDIWTPTDTGANVAIAEIQTRLNVGTNVVINTAGVGTENGDIFINRAVSWGANSTLTLAAYHNTTISANITATGDTAGLVVMPGTGGNYSLNNGAVIILSGATPSITIAGNPYTVINSIAALQNMGSGLTGRYVLGSNIDASATSGWNSGAGFAPVGDSGTQFTGIFDGLNHIITGLTINRPSTDYVGLFGYTNGATIRNAGMVGGNVTGNSYVGGLVGYNYGASSITNSYNTGSVTGNLEVGGLVGVNGLVGGSSASSIINSYSTGSVNGSAYRIGGLVGGNWGGAINNSYATGSVNGNDWEAGGLVGGNRGVISNSYATGSVYGRLSAGGLAGLNGVSLDPGVTITNSYSTGSVTCGAVDVGGLVGWNSSTITNSYWDKEKSGRSNCFVGSGGGTCTGQTTPEMMTQANFSGWDFADTWWMSEGNSRPFLRSEYRTEITNAHQLQLMAMNATTLAASYTLGSDVSLAELSQPSGLWNTTAGFIPVGNSSTNFTGTFDGLSHTITGLMINRPMPEYAGLFGAVGGTGIVRNIGLVGGSVSGSEYYSNAAVGGLVGYNYGTVGNSYNTGSVENVGRSFAGGLVGTNMGSITSCYATGNVSIAESRAGGLVGHNGGTISNSYANGNVIGNTFGNNCCANAGLVGHNAGSISNSYSTGSAVGWYQVGGFVGEQSGSPSYSNNFWDTTTSGMGGGYGATGLNTSQMMAQASFTGWDFINIWHINEGSTYPLLNPVDTTPGIFTFTEQSNVAVSTLITSNTITVSGISATAEISIIGGQYQINNGFWGSSAGTVNNGDAVTVRQTSSADYLTKNVTTLTIGGISVTFSVTTIVAPDPAPDAFTFNTITNAQPATVFESNPAIITGINMPSPISISGGEYAISIDGGSSWGTWVSAAGIVNLNNQVKVKLMSADTPATQVTATLTIGGISGSFDVTTSAVPVASLLPQNGLIALWRAENNALDSIGSNHGTAQNGATFATGKYGQGFSFDGNDDYINVPYTSSLDVQNSLTIAAWINSTNNNSQNRGIAGKAGGYQLYVEAGGHVVFGFNNGSWTLLHSAITIPENIWVHVAGTFNAATGSLQLYINGMLDANFTTTERLSPNVNPVMIGGFGIYGSPFSGRIDDVAIYNRALTATEIGYFATPPPHTGVVRAYIPNHDSNSITVIDPTTGTTTTINGTIDSPYSTAVSPDGRKVYIGSYSTTSTTNGINVLDTATNTLSVLPQVTGNFMGIAVSPDGKKLYASRRNGDELLVVNSADGSNSSITGFSLPGGVAVTPDGIKVYVADYNNNRVRVITTSNYSVAEISDGSLQHPWGVAMSPDGKTVFVGNEGSTNISIIDTSMDTVTGNIPVGSTVSTVIVTPNGATLYAGYAGSNTVPVIDIASKTVVASVPVSAAEGISVTPDGTRVVIANYSNPTATIINTTGNSIENLVATGAGPRSFGNFIAAPPAVTSGLVSLWRGEGNAFDVIGGNHGVTNNGVSYSGGVNGTAFSFDGIDDYIDVGMLNNTALNESRPFSISAWINSTDTTPYQTIISNYMGESGATGNYSTYFTVSSGNLNFGINKRQIDETVASTPISVGWHYVTATYDSSTLNLYLDGELKSSATRTFSGSTNNTRGWYIGNFPPEWVALWYNTSFKGQIDELAIYNRALAPFEISALYTGSDITPDPFSFTPVTNAERNTVYTSPNTITVTGISAMVPVSISGGAYSIGCTGTNTSSAGTVSNNETVCVRVLSADTPATTTSATLTIGGISSTFDVTTNPGYILTFATAGNGTLSGAVSQTINNGSSATPVKAVPAPGYHFINWTGSGGFVTTTANPLTVTNVTADQAITANFAGFTSVGTMGVARHNHTATPLPNGKVLVAGGFNNGYQTSAELYDPATGSWSATGAMNYARGVHTATVLPNGKVLVAAGYGATGATGEHATAELYDPVTGVWSVTGSLSTARHYHTTTLLKNGKVLVVGGHDGTQIGVTATAELYDPATGTWSATAPMITARAVQSAILLQNGNVLVAGGGDGSTCLNSAEIYDPATGTWSSTGALPEGLQFSTATLLPNGKVLLTGGNAPDGSVRAKSYVYDPAAGIWTETATMTNARTAHSAVLLPNGKVFVVGGNNSNGFPDVTELFDPVVETWSLSTTLSMGREFATATLMSTGEVLTVGGMNYNGILNSAEVYDIDDATAIPTMNEVGDREHAVGTILLDGTVLITGGQPLNGPTHDTAEIYDPAITLFTATTGTMGSPRYYHNATLLPNGKVFVSGGNNYYDGAWHYLNSTDLYDPVARTFSAGANLLTPRAGHTSVLLADGTVLVAGGDNGGYSPAAEIYDPNTNTTKVTGSMKRSRAWFASVLLKSGKVLIVGGSSLGDNTCELYDPTTGLFTLTGSTNVFHGNYMTATLLPNGKVLVAGGYTGSQVNDAEIYDPETGTFTLTGSFNKSHWMHQAILLHSGKALILGGTANYPDSVIYPELYDPATGQFTTVANPMVSSYRADFVAALLSDGSVLSAGGQSNQTGEIFYPRGNLENSRRPVMTSLVFAGGKATISGTGLRGDSEATSGSTVNSATNYPVLRLQRVDNNAVTFLTSDSSTNWSATDFVSAQAGDLPGGLYLANIISNGIPAAGKFFAVVPVNSYTLTFNPGNHGTLTGSTTQSIDHGASATAVTAVPAYGYHFVNWSGTGGFADTTDNPLTVTNVTADQIITAKFAINPIVINIDKPTFDNPTGRTSNPVVSLTLTYDGATAINTQMQFLIDKKTTWSVLEQFKATGKTVTLPTGNGIKTVSVRFIKDGVASQIYSASIFLDGAAPTGTISINNGAATTDQKELTLYISADDSDSSQLQMRLSEDGKSWDESSWVPYAPTYVYILGTLPRPKVEPLSYGVKKVYVQFRDDSDIRSKAYSDSITYVAQAVDPGTVDASIIKLNGGNGLTKSKTVSLTLHAPVAENYVRLSNDITTLNKAKWILVASVSTWALTSGDGLKTVYAQYSQSPAAGQTPATTYSASITLDTVVPTGWLLINDGAFITNNATVDLTIGATDVNGIAKMCIKETSAACINPVDFEDYKTSRTYTFTGIVNPVNLVKNLFIRFKDNSGNISTPVKTSITLDTTAPTKSKLIINGGKITTQTAAITLALTSTGAVTMRISPNIGVYEWEPYVKSKTITLPDIGSQTVQAEFKDLAGNVTAATATITWIPPATPASFTTAMLSGHSASVKLGTTTYSMFFNDTGILTVSGKPGTWAINLDGTLTVTSPTVAFLTDGITFNITSANLNALTVTYFHTTIPGTPDGSSIMNIK
jgi:YVTN family beta-propeller protein